MRLGQQYETSCLVFPPQGSTPEIDGNITTIRLVDGSSPYEGRVEVYLHGSWGTVCDDLWDINDATVACRQLGFGRANLAASSARFGSGNGSILLDNVACDGTEASLDLCNHNGIGIHDCEHAEDAGVICSQITSAGMYIYARLDKHRQ